MMRFEGTGGRTDLKRRQDRRINFKEALAVKIGADLFEDQATLDKGVLNFRVDDEINITLTIAHIHVFQAVELFRQRKKRFCKHFDGFRVNGNFASFGAEHEALNADNVADVEFFEFGESIFPEVVDFDIDLHFAVTVMQVAEERLAHITATHHSARKCDILIFKFVEIFDNIFGIMRKVEFNILKRIASVRNKCGEFITAYLQNFVQILFRFDGFVRNNFLCHWNVLHLIQMSLPGCPAGPKFTY